jgi:signal peptidase I
VTGNRAARRVLTVLRELALTGGAVAGALCLLFALLGATAGVRPLVFTSGSMAPTIRTGDLAITRPVELDRVAPGDVVSVLDARGMRVTHRVVDVDTERHLLRLKGDANDVADPFPYPVDRVDRVLFAVPAGGYLLTWSGRPTAQLLLGAYLAFVLWTLCGRGPLWTRATSSKPAQRPGRSSGRGWCSDCRRARCPNQRRRSPHGPTPCRSPAPT